MPFAFLARARALRPDFALTATTPQRWPASALGRRVTSRSSWRPRASRCCRHRRCWSGSSGACRCSPVVPEICPRGSKRCAMPLPGATVAHLPANGASPIGVFAGGWTLAAPRSDAGDRSIASPRSHRARRQESHSPDRGVHGEPRRMLETIREFAVEQLEASQRRRIRPSARPLLRPCGGQCRRPAARPAGEIDRLRVDLDNLRAALSWSPVTRGGIGGTELGLRFVVTLAILVLAEPVCRGSPLDRSGPDAEPGQQSGSPGGNIVLSRHDRPPLSATTRRQNTALSTASPWRAGDAATEGHALFALSLVAACRGDHQAAASHARSGAGDLSPAR